MNTKSTYTVKDFQTHLNTHYFGSLKTFSNIRLEETYPNTVKIVIHYIDSFI